MGIATWKLWHEVKIIELSKLKPEARSCDMVTDSNQVEVETWFCMQESIQTLQKVVNVGVSKLCPQ
jgi:hypothetical protein